MACAPGQRGRPKANAIKGLQRRLRPKRLWYVSCVAQYVPLTRLLHRQSRIALALMPQALRFAAYRNFVRCDYSPDPRLSLKIADTREELEACFRLLHDAYVASGFMRADPSGLRVNIFHALPTTTTLCAKFEGEVVGTISLIRESAFGFPLQSIFDLRALREKRGRIAEVSALAVEPRYRNTGGSVLFPLMKFMYQYCEAFFDTRHLVIAVNPRHIEMYESLMLFQRLAENQVDNYDFANGAPAVGATLDLHLASRQLQEAYRDKPPRKNLHHYFALAKLPHITMPTRRYFTTNDPVMTPALLDYFFNQRTRTFEQLQARERGLLHAIYNLEKYAAVLPPLPLEATSWQRQRAHARYSLKCPARFVLSGVAPSEHQMLVIECSDDGFLALSQHALPLQVWGQAHIRLGHNETSVIRAMSVRVQGSAANWSYGFSVTDTDLPWRTLVGVLQWGSTHEDLNIASQFLAD
jgi:GNAT superfamily N-acetyltransferase